MEWMNRNLVILDNGNIYGTFKIQNLISKCYKN